MFGKGSSGGVLAATGVIIMVMSNFPMHTSFFTFFDFHLGMSIGLLLIFISFFYTIEMLTEIGEDEAEEDESWLEPYN